MRRMVLGVAALALSVLGSGVVEARGGRAVKVVCDPSGGEGYRELVEDRRLSYDSSIQGKGPALTQRDLDFYKTMWLRGVLMQADAYLRGKCYAEANVGYRQALSLADDQSIRDRALVGIEDVRPYLK